MENEKTKKILEYIDKRVERLRETRKAWRFNLMFEMIAITLFIVAIVFSLHVGYIVSMGVWLVFSIRAGNFHREMITTSGELKGAFDILEILGALDKTSGTPEKKKKESKLLKIWEKVKQLKMKKSYQQ